MTVFNEGGSNITRKKLKILGRVNHLGDVVITNKLITSNRIHLYKYEVDWLTKNGIYLEKLSLVDLDFTRSIKKLIGEQFWESNKAIISKDIEECVQKFSEWHKFQKDKCEFKFKTNVIEANRFGIAVRILDDRTEENFGWVDFRDIYAILRSPSDVIAALSATISSPPLFTKTKGLLNILRDNVHLDNVELRILRDGQMSTPVRRGGTI